LKLLRRLTVHVTRNKVTAESCSSLRHLDWTAQYSLHQILHNMRANSTLEPTLERNEKVDAQCTNSSSIEVSKKHIRRNSAFPCHLRPRSVEARGNPRVPCVHPESIAHTRRPAFLHEDAAQDHPPRSGCSLGNRQWAFRGSDRTQQRCSGELSYRGPARSQ